MNFQLSEEQRILKDQLARFIDNEYDFSKRETIVEESRGFAQEKLANFGRPRAFGTAL